VNRDAEMSYNLAKEIFDLIETALDGGKTALDGGKTALDGGKTILDGGKTIIDSGKTIIDSGKTILDSGKTILDSGKTGINEGAMFISFTHDKKFSMYGNARRKQNIHIAFYVVAPANHACAKLERGVPFYIRQSLDGSFGQKNMHMAMTGFK
jgi:hypothetical protein